MKKYLSIMLMFLVLFGPLTLSAAAVPADIVIELDGQVLFSDVPPLVQNNRTLVPIRTIAEALNLQVEWKAELEEIDIAGNGMFIQMRIGESQAFKNGKAIRLDTPPVIYKERTMLPIRFVTEALGCQVVWNGNTRTVSINSVPSAMDVVGFYALGDAATSSWTDLFEAEYPQSTQGNTDVITELALGWFTMNEQGELLSKSASGWQRPDGWNNVIDTAASYQLKTQICVQMTDKNARIRKMMNDPAARNLAINSIVNESANYNGVNLDFEGLGWHDTPEELSKVRADFTLFVQDLANPLHAGGKTLSLTLHAPNTEYPGYDYAALGRAADQIIIMAYDYGPKPEPNAQVEQAVKLASAEVAPNRLLLGISVISESESSIAGKINIAKQYGLGGISLWRLGLVSDDEWKVIRENI